MTQMSRTEAFLQQNPELTIGIAFTEAGTFHVVIFEDRGFAYEAEATTIMAALEELENIVDKNAFE